MLAHLPGAGLHNSGGGVLADCIRSVVRTVWDGDQVLYEVSAPGGSTAPAAEMERDTGHRVAMANDRNYYGFGRVAYAHGLGIDDPVTVVRMEYSESIPWAVSIQPLANWAGRYDGGVGIECMEYRGAESIRLREETWPPGEVRERNLWDDGDYVRHCTDADWPAQGAWLNLHRKPTQFHPRRAWMGSLIAHGQDASGQYYRRNRYYDASTGRFTQEDPIGLAGGINLYGYANGDPVSYADPYGLSPEMDDEEQCCRNDASPQQLRQEVAMVRAGAALRGGRGRVSRAADRHLAGTAEDPRRPKAINLPSWRRVDIDMEHVASGHVQGGSRVSPQKDLFHGLTSRQIERTVRDAYRHGERIRTQGERVLVQGESGGYRVEMWVNTRTRTIETAYPIRYP